MEQARAYVKNDAWGMLVINRGLSAGLSAALSSGAVYNASAALTLLEQSGHHPIAQLMFIQPTLVQVAGAVASAMAVKQLAAYQSSGNITSRTSTNLHALLNPVGWTVENLGLFDFQLSTLVMPMAMLISFICVLVPLMMLKFGSYAAYKTTKHQHIYIALVFVALILCLVYSLFGTLAFLAFKGPDYGPKHQGLPITSGLVFSLWMCFFITLFPMALWLKALVTLVPPAFVAVPSVLTIIPSMCAGMTVVDLSPKFFRWMQALPFYQGGMLARYIVSGAHRRLGANLGILLGETAFSAALLYVATRINQHNVFTGAVDRMGNYRGTLGYTGSALVEPKAATLPTEPQVSSQSLESGIRQNAHAPSTTMSIVDDNDNVDAAMRNETLAI
ncbi:hypothetical protein EV174_000918 [Coemansia sp. RSA 2320]|nr:hypothetical protein EV174_000918 [Coemansia sp. RSA 2320]